MQKGEGCGYYTIVLITRAHMYEVVGIGVSNISRMQFFQSARTKFLEAAMQETITLEQQLEKLKLENEQLKKDVASKTKPLHCKVSVKGALSLYGLNARFPVTLYKEQWLKVINFIPSLQAFISDHDGEFSSK